MLRAHRLPITETDEVVVLVQSTKTIEPVSGAGEAHPCPGHGASHTLFQ